MAKKPKIFYELERIAPLIPAPVYWLDTNYVIVGANDLCLDAIGTTYTTVKEALIGKKYYDYYPQDIAEELTEKIKIVMDANKAIKSEEIITDVTTGKFRYYETARAPLHDSKGNIVGTICTAIETTDKKEAELREQENQAHMLRAEKDDQFRTVVRQLGHDINAPISSINNIVSRLSNTIPENDRVTLRNASERIAGISQKLISKYEKHSEDDNEVFLVSLALTQIINERREDHRDTGVIIELDIDEDAKFSCVKHNSGIFKRMVSNLVKNAVEAVKDKSDGKVIVELAAIASKIAIVVMDNGAGMPEHIQKMFIEGIEVTEGKEYGHGIGLTQVRDAVNLGGGKYKVYAGITGTRINVWFPLVDTPAWIATQINLTRDDTIIILDDDPSIHGSWNSSLEESLAENPTLKVVHFSNGHEAVIYINSLTPTQKQDVFLLTDFELLDQNINGMEVVNQTDILRAILVTSHSSRKKMQDQVIKAGIKILPKELAASAKIKVDKKIPVGSNVVDMVWVEDQKFLVDSIVAKHYSNLKVDVYYNPVKFMENVHQYPLNTRIILDTYYEAEDGTPYLVTGYQLARQLHAMGFTKLIIYAGEAPKNTPPEYLQVVSKGELHADQTLDKI